MNNKKIENNATAHNSSAANYYVADVNDLDFPHKCRECDYFMDGLGCNNASRMNPSRFPLIHYFMKKNIGGWLKLPYDKSERCRYYLAKKIKAT